MQAWPIALQGLDLIGIAQVSLFVYKLFIYMIHYIIIDLFSDAIVKLAGTFYNSRSGIHITDFQ